MKLHEVAPPKAAKLTMAQKLAAVEVGEKPDAALQAFLQKLADKAEKIVFKRVLNHTDDYGIDYDTPAKEVRDGINVWTQFVHLGEKGIAVDLNADTDNVGGDSTNHEQVFFTLDGKDGPDGRTLGHSAGAHEFTGEIVAMFDAQADWEREE